ncbi:MAG: SWIM zinc finger family protein [Dehalococcoidia bacterium]
MHSGMIGKVEKAHRYAEQRDRFRIDALTVTVSGENDSHRVTLDGASWRCSCDFFGNNATCAHTMALELMLDGMLPAGVGITESDAA